MIRAINEVMLAAGSSLAASIVVKATVLVTLGLAGAWMARKSRAAVRYAVLAAAFGMLLVLPVVSIVAPTVRVELPAAAPEQVAAAVVPVTTAIPAAVLSRPELQRPAISPRAVLLAAWIGGMALFLTPMVFGGRQVRWLRRSATPWPQGQTATDRLAAEAGIYRRVEVLLHERLQVPMTCGVAHPAIVLPIAAAAWEAEDLNRAMVHELEHVRRGDWVSQCLARAVCSLYWFHPLVWMAWRRLTLEAERSCDDAVLGRFDAIAYADQLVALALRLASAGKSPVLAMVSRSDLATRVGAVLDNRQPRGRAGRLPILLACAAAAALVVAVSPVRVVAAQGAVVVASAPREALANADPRPLADTPAAPAPHEAAPVADSVPDAAPAIEAPIQDSNTPPQAAPVVQLSARTELVIVNVTITDQSGKSIDGLGSKDFVLVEDGVTQKIATFEFQRVEGPPAGKPNAPSSYYTLGYYPTNDRQDGQFRKIQVMVNSEAGAKVAYRAGYYPNNPLLNRPGGGETTSVVIGPSVALPPGSTAPIPIYKPEPEYSEEARKAKYQGNIVLSVDVSDTGKVTRITVLHSLGLGLDEQAIKAVQQWMFKPGTTNGKPVTMAAQVRIDFRLL